MKNEIFKIFNSYPEGARNEVKHLRDLIYEVAKENEINDLEECLKWGEPSYTSKHGSTLRINWRKAAPNNYFMYFHCKTKLVETFKEIYPTTFTYSGNRAIVFDCGAKVPDKELKNCIYMSLKYHSIKHLPLLGA